MARTRTADLGGALEGLQSALVELASLRDVSEIVEAALRWELELMSSELAFVRLAGEPGDTERLHTRSATAGEGVEAQRLDDLLSHARDLAHGGSVAATADGGAHVCVHVLHSAGRTLGVTGVRREQAFTDVERLAFSMFANQLAATIEIMRLRQSQGETTSVLSTLRQELERSEHERMLNEERAQSAARVERAHELAVAALHTVSVHASSNHSMSRFYRRLTASIAELVDARKVLFWQLDDKGILSAMPGAYGIDDKFIANLITTTCGPGRDDLASRVVFHDEIFRASRGDDSKDFMYVLEALGVKDAISVPWRAGDTRLGLVAAYDSKNPDGFTREDTWVLQKAGLAAALVWQLRHAENDLQKTIERLQKVDAARQQLLKNVATAVDKAGKRFASELHDDALQKLTAVALHLQRLNHLQGRDGSTLAEVQGLLAQTEDSLRRLLFEVRPPALDDPGGLKEAVRERLAMLHSLTDAEVDVELDLPDDLPYQLKSTVFRQVAEALTNIEKHANAARVQLSLRLAHGAIHGVVVDDGQGFVVSERNNLPGHLGLLSLRERAILAGGWYKIESEPGSGTRIEFALPVA